MRLALELAHPLLHPRDALLKHPRIERNAWSAARRRVLRQHGCACVSGMRESGSPVTSSSASSSAMGISCIQ
jgi:hypothetical protein